MRQGDTDGRKIVGSNKLDLISNRLGLLFRFDENMRACRAPF